jgi:hypothetical protein
MAERDRDPLLDVDDPRGTPPERRGRDGEAGTGDMLGGLGAGAGDRLGPNLDEDDPEARPSANQHSFAGEEFATDTARHYHGRDSPV